MTDIVRKVLLKAEKIAAEPKERLLAQYLKFGISGVVGVATSTVLFYGFKSKLPVLTLTLIGWVPLDIVNLSYYLATTIIGGSIHFLLSKVWVFETK